MNGHAEQLPRGPMSIEGPSYSMYIVYGMFLNV